MIPPDGPQSDSQEGTSDAIESEAHLRRRAPSVTARARADTAFVASIDAPPTENFEFYRPPTQMVHWGQPQHLPHTNWFDLFFDLIYVATAFQLGTLLSYNVDAAGVTYFLALFYTMLASWHAKLGVDARIDATDGFHKIVDIVEALLVAASALHIEGHLSDIRDLKTHSALGFSLTTCALRLITTLRWHEVAVAGEICEISEEAKLHCRGLRNASFLGFLTYGLSALASLEGYNHNSADVACGLWITGVILNYMTPFVFGIFISAKLSSQAHRIPMHIEYSLHRNGEWIMLMIGASFNSICHSNFFK
jgi:low temperature requirement protein LtrA